MEEAFWKKEKQIVMGEVIRHIEDELGKRLALLSCKPKGRQGLGTRSSDRLNALRLYKALQPPFANSDSQLIFEW